MNTYLLGNEVGDDDTERHESRFSTKIPHCTASVSNMYVHVAKVQSCANHEVRMGSSTINFGSVEIAFIIGLILLV